ncbi:protein of unknown function [Chitinophaga costaii]|uniref:DUF4271 domain-containing protein n=1 Tax=Chitinophaga costaii TaxID=1335309 RepID=A0A1C4B3E0_9BACT|nr:DUF4271 domain-containing protein [Chitinophaga costaii]SCC01401.1 protein of unknown function [Chitinophaga costaii]
MLFAQTGNPAHPDTGQAGVKKSTAAVVKRDSLGHPVSSAPKIRRDSLGRPLGVQPVVRRDSLGRIIAPVKRDSLGRPILAKVKRDSLGRILPRARPDTGLAAQAGARGSWNSNNPSATAADSAAARVAAAAIALKPAHRPSASSLAYDSLMHALRSSNLLLNEPKPHYYDMNPLRNYHNMDWLVYIMLVVTLILGIIRMVYQKYFTDLFRAFTNPTLSQRQLKDQLSQSPFPNFLLNIFFAISLGVYLFLVMYRQQYISGYNPLMLIPALILLVAVIYFIKYVVLRLCGWLFGNEELVDAYIFILYLVNKVAGVVLLPFLVILAFCSPPIAKFFLYISIIFIVLLIVYRYIRSYSLVKQYLSFSKLHFFLYLCAFEVAPVLILTKVLLKLVNG